MSSEVEEEDVEVVEAARRDKAALTRALTADATAEESRLRQTLITAEDEEVVDEDEEEEE